MTDRPEDRRLEAGAGPEGDAADRLLAAAFAQQPVPELSARFDARLERRLEAERLRIARRKRRWRWLLAAYWVAAAVAIAALVQVSGQASGWTLHLPADAWTPVLAMAVLTLAGVALPLAALADRWSRTPGLPRRFNPPFGP